MIEQPKSFHSPKALALKLLLSFNLCYKPVINCKGIKLEESNRTQISGSEYRIRIVRKRRLKLLENLVCQWGQ